MTVDTGVSPADFPNGARGRVAWDFCCFAVAATAEGVTKDLVIDLALSSADEVMDRCGSDADPQLYQQMRTELARVRGELAEKAKELESVTAERDQLLLICDGDFTSKCAERLRTHNEGALAAKLHCKADVERSISSELASARRVLNGADPHDERGTDRVLADIGAVTELAMNPHGPWKHQRQLDATNEADDLTRDTHQSTLDAVRDAIDGVWAQLATDDNKYQDACICLAAAKEQVQQAQRFIEQQEV